MNDEVDHTQDVDEKLDDEDIVYQINTFGADYTVEGLGKRFIEAISSGRNFKKILFGHGLRSKFIESILPGLPIPSVFLYREEKTQKHLIVDGLQRLSTLLAFHKGRFPHNDRVFHLKDVKSRFDLSDNQGIR